MSELMAQVSIRLSGCVWKGAENAAKWFTSSSLRIVLEAEAPQTGRLTIAINIKMILLHVLTPCSEMN